MFLQKMQNLDDHLEEEYNIFVELSQVVVKNTEKLLEKDIQTLKLYGNYQLAVN